MPGTDVHTHLAPLLSPEQVSDLVGVATSEDRLVLDGHQAGPAKLYDAQALAAHLDETGLDRALVSPPPPFYRQHLPEDDARAWVRAVNAGILARIEGQPSLRALAYLPLEYPELALEEYQRVRADRTFAGVTAAAGGSSAALSADELDPLWRALDDDAAVLLLHPGTSHDPRLDAFYLANLLGNPSETAVAAAHLVFGGVLSRFPHLRVVLVHCGGTLPAVVGRWQRGVDTQRPGISALPESPKEVVRRLYVDCLAHDPAVVDLAIATFGVDRILLGSDWPFPMGADQPTILVEHRGPDFVRRVAVDNPASLLAGVAVVAEPGR